MGRICDRLVGEAGEETLANEGVLGVIRRSKSRREKSGDGEQRSCGTHDDMSVVRE